MRWLVVSLLVAPLAFGASHAHAQANPSAADIIKQLTPTGSSLTGTAPRGIHTLPSQDQPAASAATAPAAGSVRQAATGSVARPTAPPPSAAMAPSVNLTVNFLSGSAELTPEAKRTLDDLGQALSSSALAQYKFRVEGHTDTVGSPAYNRSLSARRADAVVAYIASKYNVAADRMQPVGMGSDRPLVPTPDQTPEARNRRVQVVNVGS